MKKFKVSYTGFAYIEAETPEEAEECFDNEEFSYKETSVDSIVEVDDFFVEL